MTPVLANIFPLHKQLGGVDYRVDLARTDEHKQQIYSMRYQIFNLELGSGQAGAIDIDKDLYDDYCDHLVVIEEASKQVVGTYRLLLLDHVKDSIGLYSATEFDLSFIYAANLKLVEVGRACIDEQYRNGFVISLLWYGLGAYMQALGLEYVCGCASMNKGQSPELASQIYQLFNSHHRLVSDDLQVKPLEKNRLPGFDADITLFKAGNVKRQMSTLLRSYFSIGSFIGGEPAYDPDFQVIDFFVLLELAKLNKGAARFLS
tara:strand:- start:6772 stop:7554 length:783 start_codon:yes stop_codon:yes gene_type:complete